MGLDMYLNGKRYLSKYFNEGDEKTATEIKNMFPELQERKGRWGNESPVKEVSIEAGYWRKANAIHAWFVKNCQDGTDDCGNYRVAREQLKELRDICQRVIDFKHMANELLPTQNGFFFGATEYDEYYYRDLEQTVQIIDDALGLPESWEFEYHSSW